MTCKNTKGTTKTRHEESHLCVFVPWWSIFSLFLIVFGVGIVVSLASTQVGSKMVTAVFADGREEDRKALGIPALLLSAHLP